MFTSLITSWIASRVAPWVQTAARYVIPAIAAVAVVAYVLHWASAHGAVAERAKWVAQQAKVQQELQAKADKELEAANKRAEEGEARAAEMQRRVKEIEDASRNNNAACVTGPDAERLRKLRK